MTLAPDVERWLSALGEPPRQAMRRVVEIVLGADRRMSVEVKYWTLVFAGGGGDFCSFVQWKKKTPVTLMYNRGARLKGKYPHLEGDGPTARFMRFADLAEVNARAAELGKTAQEWCELMAADAGGAPAKPKRKAPKPKKKK